ncbi:uncharacterized protein N7479_010054 [Penicillium vulpinum]|uniref:Aminoglycoside phosphotransferase domain-containing protein n=1 Tax=Penicillium vulpinum TaxID=29845 RepID=A0A1V6RVR5_9EURO|nr:uncharacterized protein N7479_010054 [Penicillium vulpinum]KAJ5951641.1 hypothetical protein N7479_010054 [Penicillium vulpinum]OQE05610.1 hypothetical protein PENVUL_c023G01694 [Penicillium vulpinum]
MDTPDSYLPPALSADTISRLIVSLNLPAPSSIEPLHVTAAFHSIYLVHFAAIITPIHTYDGSVFPVNANGSVTLVLRVSGRQLPSIKTRNEVGVMTWIRQNTTIPIPAIIRYDSTDNNIIRHEFTLLEKVPGKSIDQIYHTLSADVRTKIVHQLTDYLIELHAHPWDGYVGGLTITNGEINKGPPIEENFWQLPDVEKYWAGSESLELLNPIPSQGFPSFVDFTLACLNRYIYAIEKHSSLESYRDLIPRIRTFITSIQDHADGLNQVVYVLAHKDLHFANIMCDPDHPDCPITGVLDWEFSSVVPAPRWNPPRAFLWNMKSTPEDKEEQTRMEKLFESVCCKKGAGKILKEMELSPLQQSMQTAVNYIRAIVEVCPRGQAKDRVAHWRGVAEAAMEAFGV